MAYVPNNDSLRRQNIIGFVGDATSRSGVLGSAIYQYGYVTPDTAATVETANYFDAAASLLNVGDCIDAVMVTGGTPVSKSYIVTANAAHVVIALQTATAG